MSQRDSADNANKPLKKAILFIWYRFYQIFFRILFTIYFRFEVIGKNNLKGISEGGLVTSNHASYLDPAIVGSPWPFPIFYFARDTLFRYKFAKFWMTSMNAIPVKRGKIDLGAIRNAIKIVKRGDSLVVFPEGTRTTDGKLQKVRRGVGMIAYRSKAWIYPVYIEGSFKAWPKGQKFPLPQKFVFS